MMMKDQIPLVRELGKRQDPCLLAEHLPRAAIKQQKGLTKF
jgi:hypothetical protein